MNTRFRRAHIIAVLSIVVFALVSACAHRRDMRVGTHKVKVSRHGHINSLHADGDKFKYVGSSMAGTRFEVVIEGDSVRVNGRDVGMLKPGDSVLVGDDGVRVNNLDYGDSERYMRENAQRVFNSSSKAE